MESSSNNAMQIAEVQNGDAADQPQPRQPKNLQGLLKFALEATKAEDAPGNSHFEPLDEERRQFLENALRSMTIDTAELLRAGIRVLGNIERMQMIAPDDDMPDDVIDAFESVLSIVDDIDIANDFYKLGGFTIFPVCFSCRHAQVKEETSNLLAVLCQNNPFCQTKAIEFGLFSIVVNMLENEVGPLVLTKSMYALSSIVREFSPSIPLLMQINGSSVLIKCLAKPIISLRTKTSFLINYLCSNHPTVKRALIKDGLVKSLISALAEGRNAASEHLLSALHSIVSDNEVLTQCSNPEFKLRQILQNHLKNPELADYIEEKEYCQEILDKVFQLSK